MVQIAMERDARCTHCGLIYGLHVWAQINSKEDDKSGDLASTKNSTSVQVCFLVLSWSTPVRVGTPDPVAGRVSSDLFRTELNINAIKYS